MKKVSILCFTVTFLSVVSMGSLANEEFDAVATDGPGVLTGEKGNFPVFERLKKNKKNSNEERVQDKSSIEPRQIENKSVELNANADIDAYTEFELFKELKIAKSENSDLYQEFLDWVKFLKFKSANKSQ